MTGALLRPKARQGSSFTSPAMYSPICAAASSAGRGITVARAFFNGRCPAHTDHCLAESDRGDALNSLHLHLTKQWILPEDLTWTTQEHTCHVSLPVH